jgi:hypothetical protein
VAQEDGPKKVGGPSSLMSEMHYTSGSPSKAAKGKVRTLHTSMTREFNPDVKNFDKVAFAYSLE